MIFFCFFYSEQPVTCRVHVDILLMTSEMAKICLHMKKKVHCITNYWVLVNCEIKYPDFGISSEIFIKVLPSMLGSKLVQLLLEASRPVQHSAPAKAP